MNVFVEFPESHPICAKIEQFFRKKKGWTIVSDGFGVDYVIRVESFEPALVYVDSSRVLIATEYINRRIRDVKKGKLNCGGLIDLLDQKVYLPTGQLTTWHHFTTEHCFAVDEEL